MSQFKFLQSEFSTVFDPARKAEEMALSDPRGACFYARLALEVTVDWLYAHDSALRNPYQSTLSARIHEPTFIALVGQKLLTKAKIIKDLGNWAAHDAKTIAPDRATQALQELFHLSYWLVHTYGKGEKPTPSITFQKEALPKTTQVETGRLTTILEQFQESKKAREKAEKERIQTEEDRNRLEAEIKALQAEIAKIKKQNAARPDTHDYTEAQTRDLFIDLLLNEAGWPLNAERDREYPVTGMPNNSGDGFVDYVLWGDDGKPLGLVEAKRTKKDPRVGQQQSKLYADCLETQFGQRPVIFYTNGYEHWMWDDRRYPPREVSGFLKKDELALMIQRRTSLKPLATATINTLIVERYYQTRAIRRICETFEKDNLRKALLVMATGSGKTRTVIALCDLLMRSNWAKRVLFLADRVALVNQSVNAFKKFLNQSSPVNLVTDKTAHGRVYVSTYPTMMNLIEESQNGVRRFGPGHFDLIIIDEAHRSVYQKYKAIFDYFDSFLVGLTATPKADSDHDTYDLFDLEVGVPTDAYELDEAVGDGFLVPPRAISVPLKFQRDGIQYDELSAHEKEAWDAMEWDDDGNIPTQVDPAALNKWLFNEDTVDKVLAFLMKKGIKVADGEHLGKTIIFAKSRDHANFIQDRFDKKFSIYQGHFARVIEHKTEYAQSIIDDFSTPEKSPHIAISVDMLDTGIDVPEVVNLVFFKLVRSKTKFWQMIGRGTRLRKNLFGPGNDKEFFSIFDFCQNFEFFNANPTLAEPSSAASLSERLFTKRIELITEIKHRENSGSSGPMGETQQEFTEYLKKIVLGMNLDHFVVRQKRKLVEKFQAETIWDQLKPEDYQELNSELAGLPSTTIDDDLSAKQFDLLIFNTELALLRVQKRFQKQKKQIREIASHLEELRNIPSVEPEMELILDMQTDDFWQDITVPILENIRKRLRSLIKLIEIKSRANIYSDFQDEMGEESEVELRGLAGGLDLYQFRLKVKHFLKDHENHVTIQKLRKNLPLTPSDLSELENVFIAQGIGQPEDISKIKEDVGLGLFIRSLTGLDREAAKTAFQTFLDGLSQAPTADQIQFVNMIIDYLTERGIMEPRCLYESPFTDLDSFGVEGVFPRTADVQELIAILEDIKRRAVA